MRAECVCGVAGCIRFEAFKRSHVELELVGSVLERVDPTLDEPVPYTITVEGLAALEEVAADGS